MPAKAEPLRSAPDPGNPESGTCAEAAPNKVAAQFMMKYDTCRARLILAARLEGVGRVRGKETAVKIGFIGLGQMGTGMALSLIRAGHDLTVYNRSPHKVQPLVNLGAKAAADVAGACNAEVIFTMLADDNAVESVTFGEGGLLKHLPAGAGHVSSRTLSVALSERLTQAHAKAGQEFVAATVFGRPNVAASGALSVVAAGGAQPMARIAPLLGVLGHNVFTVSERPPDANLVKLSGNFLITTVIESLGEALALIEKGGIDRARYVDILTSTLFGAPIYKTYGALLLERKFTPAGFAAPLGQKDIRLVMAAADKLSVPMPMAGLVRDRFLRLLANGGERLDWSAIGNLPSIDAGLHGNPT